MNLRTLRRGLFPHTWEERMDDVTLPDLDIGTFEPHVYQNDALGFTEMLLHDCLTVWRPWRGSDGHMLDLGYDENGDLVGIKIWDRVASIPAGSNEPPHASIQWVEPMAEPRMRTMPWPDGDEELRAIGACVDLLSELDVNSAARAAEYLACRARGEERDADG